MSDTDLRQRISEDEKSEDESTGSSSASPTALAPEELLRTAADATLTEDLALSLLKRADLHPEVLERLAKNASALKSRKLRIALASHPRTPRHVSVPLARQLYTFDLMKVALSPSAPADVKVAVDDILIARLETVTLGERLTLARRASGRVAAALLLLEARNRSPRRAPSSRPPRIRQSRGRAAAAGCRKRQSRRRQRGQDSRTQGHEGKDSGPPGSHHAGRAR